MKLTIKKQKENPVLKRTELEVELNFTGATPSRENVANDIASQLKTKPEFVDIKVIKNIFGQQNGKALVYVYKDVESKKEMVELHEKKDAKTPEAAKGS